MMPRGLLARLWALWHKTLLTSPRTHLYNPTPRVPHAQPTAIWIDSYRRGAAGLFSARVWVGKADWARDKEGDRKNTSETPFSLLSLQSARPPRGQRVLIEVGAARRARGAGVGGNPYRKPPNQPPAPGPTPFPHKPTTTQIPQNRTALLPRSGAKRGNTRHNKARRAVTGRGGPTALLTRNSLPKQYT